MDERYSVQFSHSVVSESLRPHEPQHTRPPCPSPPPGVHPNSCPLSQWCHPAISSSVVPFSSCLQSFPASGSFQMNQLFASGGQSIGVSASTSVLPVNTQDWSPLVHKAICKCSPIFFFLSAFICFWCFLWFFLFSFYYFVISFCPRCSLNITQHSVKTLTWGNLAEISNWGRTKGRKIAERR